MAQELQRPILEGSWAAKRREAGKTGITNALWGGYKAHARKQDGLFPTSAGEVGRSQLSYQGTLTVLPGGTRDRIRDFLCAELCACICPLRATQIRSLRRDCH